MNGHRREGREVSDFRLKGPFGGTRLMGGKGKKRVNQGEHIGLAGLIWPQGRRQGLTDLSDKKEKKESPEADAATPRRRRRPMCSQRGEIWAKSSDRNNA